MHFSTPHFLLMHLRLGLGKKTLILKDGFGSSKQKASCNSSKNLKTVCRFSIQLRIIPANLSVFSSLTGEATPPLWPYQPPQMLLTVSSCQFWLGMVSPGPTDCRLP